MPASHQPLNDHRHFFLILAVARHAYVVLGSLIVGGRIDPLDGRQKFVQPSKGVRVVVREHVRLVHARERMILRIFQKTRRPDCQGRTNQVKEGDQ